MRTRGEYPATVPPLIAFEDGRSSRPVDGVTDPQSRTTAPRGAAAIGGAAPVPGSRPLGGVHQSPQLRAPVRDAADGVVPAELLILAEFCRAPMAGAIQLVQGVEPRGKQGVALLKRSRRYWFGIVSPDPHGGQNSQTWLRNSCEREATPSNRHPSLSISARSLRGSPVKPRRTLGGGPRHAIKQLFEPGSNASMALQTPGSNGPAKKWIC